MERHNGKDYYDRHHGGVFGNPLKKDKAEFGMLLILTACLLISFLALGRIGELLRYLKSLQSILAVEVYI